MLKAKCFSTFDLNALTKLTLVGKVIYFSKSQVCTVQNATIKTTSWYCLINIFLLRSKHEHGYDDNTLIYGKLG